MKRIIAVLAILVSALSGCASIEPGLGNELAIPPQVPEVKIGTEDGEYREPVLASSLPHIKPATKTLMPVESNFSFSSSRRQPDFYVEERAGVPMTNVVPTEAMMRGRLLSQAYGMKLSPDFAQPEWSALGKISFLGGAEVSFNTFGASQHFVPCIEDKEKGKRCNEENLGGGIKVKLEKDVFFRGSQAFFEVNFLKNTKEGLAATFCPGLEVPLFDAFGFTLSPALAVCAGTYYTKEDRRTLPLFTFMPGISFKGFSASFNIAFIPKKFFNPFGRQAVAIGYINKNMSDGIGTDHNIPNQFPSSGNPFAGVPVTGFGSFEILFDAFFNRVKPLRRGLR